MELFKRFRKFCRQFGILPINPEQTFALNWKRLLISLIILNSSISTTLFLVYKTTNIDEVENSFFITISAIFAIPLYSLTIWKGSVILNFIGKMQAATETSKICWHFLLFKWKLNPNFIFRCDRVEWSSYGSQIFGIEYENRTSMWIVLLCVDEIVDCVRHYTASNSNGH